MKIHDLTFKQVNQLTHFLLAGKIGVMPTDTIYGIVGSALNSQTVEKIYQLRKRSKSKPMIILISSISDLNKFEIILTRNQEIFLKKIWPNPISVILPILSKGFNYLHRGKNNLAFRMPKNKKLLQILNLTGPLVAPSANLQGEKNSENIIEAKSFFGDNISFYLDEGEIKSRPSTIIELNKKGQLKLVRKGAIIIPVDLPRQLL